MGQVSLSLCLFKYTLLGGINEKAIYIVRIEANFQ